MFFQNLNFLNYNRLIFNEPKKPIRTGFISFHENKSVLVDIVIHEYY
jgi:hypothetical protein